LKILTTRRVTTNPFAYIRRRYATVKKEKISPASADFFMSEEERQRWRSRRKVFYTFCILASTGICYWVYTEVDKRNSSLAARPADLKDEPTTEHNPKDIYKEFGAALVHRNHILMGGLRLLNLHLCEGDITRERSDAVVVSVPLSYLRLGRDVPLIEKPVVADESKIRSVLGGNITVQPASEKATGEVATAPKSDQPVDPLLALNNVPTKITSSITPYFNPFNPKYFHDQQMKNLVAKYGPLNHGDVFVVDAGVNYACRKIIYAVPPVWTGGKNTTKEKYTLAELYKKVFEVADEYKLSSLTFTSIAPKYPPHVSAFVFFNTVSNYAPIRDMDRQGSAITNVRMMINHEHLEPFCKEFDKRRRMGIYL